MHAAGVCLVTPELGELNVGQAARLSGQAGRLPYEAFALAKAGRRVHVLLCGDVQDGARPALELQQHGIRVCVLSEFAFPPSVTLDGPNHFAELHRSERIRHALTLLHQEHRFARIEFPDRGALGFRTIQAKRAGLGFDDVELLVSVHGPSAWLWQHQRRRVANADEVALDYCERYAVEHADRRRIASNELTEAVTALGWNISPQACGIPDRPAPPDLPLVTVCVPCFNLGGCLEDALASLARQTYPALEVFVIDDGSTQPEARDLFNSLPECYPQFHFSRHDNQGVAATRNRGLARACGKYFLPMDGDNVAHPQMVERLVAGLERRPELAALTCDFLAFAETADIAAECFLYAYRPTGGPHVLGCIRNVYGDGNALFRTDALRAVGGFEPDRDASWEDWEVFLKLVHAGYRVDVLPAPLFYYRHRQAGFSRLCDPFANQQRVLRQYAKLEHMPPSERAALWELLMTMHQRLEFLENENGSLRRRLQSLRYSVVDRLHGLVKRVPLLGRTLKRLTDRSRR